MEKNKRSIGVSYLYGEQEEMYLWIILELRQMNREHEVVFWYFITFPQVSV